MARVVAEKMERADRSMGHNFEEESTGLSNRFNVACEERCNIYGSTL